MDPQSPKEAKSDHFIATNVPKESLRDVFRIITAKQNSLTEIFTEAVFIGPRDIEELHGELTRKFERHPSATGSFYALVSFTNFRSCEIPNWKDFKSANWNIPEIVETITFKWEFLVQFEEGAKACPFCISVRCGSSMNPALFMQYVFSKDDDQIDKLAVATAPMSCKIDFADAVISQELLDLVGRWQKRRRKPEATIPGIGFIKCHGRKFLAVLRYSIAPIAFALALGALYRFTRSPDSQQLITNAFLAKALVLACIAIAVLRFSSKAAGIVDGFLTVQIQRIGQLHVIEFTNGDKNRQTELFGKARRSVTKFLIAGAIAIIWNVASAGITYFLFESRHSENSAPATAEVQHLGK